MFAIKTQILLVLKAGQKYSKLIKQVRLTWGLKTTPTFYDFDFKMQLRARKVTGTFQKRALGISPPTGMRPADPYHCHSKCPMASSDPAVSHESSETPWNEDKPQMSGRASTAQTVNIQAEQRTLTSKILGTLNFETKLKRPNKWNTQSLKCRKTRFSSTWK